MADSVSLHLGLALSALAAAALAVAIYRLVSNQERLRRARERMLGDLLGVLVFRHDLGAIGRSLARFALSVLRYLGRSAAPVALALPYLAALFFLLDLRYGHRPLRPGEETLVTVVYPGDRPQGKPTLEHGSGLIQMTPPVWVSDRNAYSWRIRVESAGARTRAAGPGARMRDPGPGECRIRIADDDPFRPPEVDYPEREIALGRLRWPWWGFWVVETLVLGWGIAATFGVRF
ncbi:MAG: hypothetical protein HY720_23660 [Planctomycetes bacterium]|nr:hypothetical protein [Planctomycetota bacterium]